MNSFKLALIGLLLTGCTVIAPKNEIRVPEYGGSGWYMAAKGEAGGCRFVQNGEIDGCAEFTGEKCTFRSDKCPSMQTEN